MSYRAKPRNKPRKQFADRRSGAKPSAAAKAPEKDVAVCSRKRRHADEATARLSAMESVRLSADVDELYVYKCTVCHGWHLTRFKVGEPVVADNPVYVPTPEDEVLAVIRSGEVKSYFGTRARTDYRRWIHSACLQLEQDGKIERRRQAAGVVVWGAVEAGVA